MKSFNDIKIENSFLFCPKDVVGIEVGLNMPQGCPAVRLRKTKNAIELLSVGFVDITRVLPQTIEDAERPGDFWSLPKRFQAPKAAIALTSSLATFKQTADTNSPDSANTNFRHVTMMTKKNYPPVVAAVPDFLAAWLARRFPEGHKPTAHSIQVSHSAALNCFLTGPVAESNNAPSMVLFCSERSTSLAAFENNNLAIYCEQPIGRLTIKESISAKYNTDLKMVDTIIEDPDVNLSGVYKQLLQSLCRQVNISVDFLDRRKNCKIENFYIYGVTSGKKYWSSIFKDITEKKIQHLQPFGGISHSNKGLQLPASFEDNSPLFTTAIGAAKALLEDL